MKGVNVQRFADLFHMKNLTEDIDMSVREITVSEINRPALQFCGYFEYFPKERVQIVGMVEYAYLQQLEPDKRNRAIEAFFSYEIPCIVFCRGLIMKSTGASGAKGIKAVSQSVPEGTQTAAGTVVTVQMGQTSTTAD